MKQRVVILGGGVAGLGAAVVLSQEKSLEVVLIDKKEYFLNQLKMYRAFHSSIENLRIDYSILSTRLGFQFIQKEISFDSSLLAEWINVSEINTFDLTIKFDFLILCTGAESLQIYKTEDLPNETVLTLEKLKAMEPQNLIAELSRKEPERKKNIFFVGGGATSIQCCLELSDYLSSTKQNFKLHLLDREERLLSNQPYGLSTYILKKIKEKKIQYFPLTQFITAQANILTLRDLRNGRDFQEESDLTFLFPGVKPNPMTMSANGYGQLYSESGKVYRNVFAAGDCVQFEGNGFNSLSAQAAVRKTRQVAKNIIALSRDQKPTLYNYKELGFFISTGFFDAVGWAVIDFNTVSGPQAFLLKEGIELQMELFLNGLDLYI